ncbi:MAG: hypothetical protein ACHQX1_01655 [Candidatus Micrarchaeales archaeon]
MDETKDKPAEKASRMTVTLRTNYVSRTETAATRSGNKLPDEVREMITNLVTSGTNPIEAARMAVEEYRRLRKCSFFVGSNLLASTARTEPRITGENTGNQKPETQNFKVDSNP